MARILKERRSTQSHEKIEIHVSDTCCLSAVEMLLFPSSDARVLTPLSSWSCLRMYSCRYDYLYQPSLHVYFVGSECTACINRAKDVCRLHHLSRLSPLRDWMSLQTKNLVLLTLFVATEAYWYRAAEQKP